MLLIIITKLEIVDIKDNIVRGLNKTEYSFHIQQIAIRLKTKGYIFSFLQH